MTASAPPHSNVGPTDRCSARVERNVIEEVDRYTKSIAGVDIEAVRNGRGTGSNTVLTVREQRFTMTSSDVRMPLLSRCTIGDDNVVIAYIRSAPPGSRWCGIDLEEGTTIVYGPAAEHTALTRPGLCWTFGITEVGRLTALAEQLEMSIELPSRGEIRDISDSNGSRGVGAALCSLTEAAAGPSSVLDRPSGDVMRAMLQALDGQDGARIGRGRAIDSRHVTTLSIDYANEIGRIPSLGELCIAAHVSERRLRKAFVDEYGVPPARFFRAWALAEAHRRLRDDDPTHHSVADVAAGLGFFHLGRFANYYKQLYGEPPSATLRTHVVG